MAKTRLETGSMLDGFLVGDLIHRGGMAHLWEVSKPGDPAPMLMKIPVLHEGEDPAAIVSFEMEQLIMPRLKGAHVPRHIANGDFATQPYIVMERLSGETLLPQLEHLPLPATAVAAMAAKIADALEALHGQGVVHLDLKASSIMFRASGEAVLIDFGLAHHRNLPDLLQEEFRLPYGTAPYMAPEQVMGVRNDHRSDLFALGCLMYFFATGSRPFGDPQKLKGLKQRLWKDPVPPRKLNADLPPWFQEIVLRCLEVRAELAVMLRRTASRLLEPAPDARLACINVLRLNRIAMDQSLDEQGNNKHVQKLVELKDWARELKLEPRRITFHVLEAFDPAEAILDYARQNNVDHLIMGARENSTLRKILGSVSAKVAAEAPCTVTVVRNRQPAEE